jgi:hypothetical protein
MPSGQQQEAAEELLEAMFEVVKEAAALHMHAKSAAGRGGSSSRGGPQQRRVPATVWDLPGEYAGWLLAGGSTGGASGAAGGSDSTVCSAGASVAAAHRCHQLWAQLHMRRGAGQQALWHVDHALQLLQGCRAKVGPLCVCTGTGLPLAAAASANDVLRLDVLRLRAGTAQISTAAGQGPAVWPNWCRCFGKVSADASSSIGA